MQTFGNDSTQGCTKQKWSSPEGHLSLPPSSGVCLCSNCVPWREVILNESEESRAKMLRNRAFPFHIVSALFPCPELNLLLLSGRGGAEGRQEGYPLIRGLSFHHCTAALVQGSVRFGCVWLWFCLKLNKWCGLEWWSCITSERGWCEKG